VILYGAERQLPESGSLPEREKKKKQLFIDISPEQKGSFSTPSSTLGPNPLLLCVLLKLQFVQSQKGTTRKKRRIH